MKQCSKCKEWKSFSEFWYNEAKSRYHPRCRICQAADRKAWKDANREKVKHHNREWQKANPDRVRAAQERWKERNPGIAAQRMREWREKNPERHKENNKRNYEKWKARAIDAYGGNRCNCCGETEPLFLSIDHVNNDGAEHRKSVASGIKFYKWLAENGYPDGFQVLCHNCNMGKYRNGGVCPHRNLEGSETSRKA